MLHYFYKERKRTFSDYLEKGTGEKTMEKTDVRYGAYVQILKAVSYTHLCSPYTIFTRIMVPLVKPAMVTCAIFEFYWKWDDYMGSLLYLNSPEKYTVSIALKNFTDPMSSSDYGAMFAMCVLSLLPIIIIFMLLQKYIVEGVASTGIKG